MKSSPALGTRVIVTATDHSRYGKSGEVICYHGRYLEMVLVRFYRTDEPELVELADIEPEMPEAA